MNEYTRFANDLLRAATGLDVRAERIAERIGRGALETARSIAPVDEGDLRDRLSFRRDGSRAVVESDEYYSRFQEFGTSQMAPNPFMGPTADVWTPRLVAEVEGIRDDVVDAL